MLILQPKNCLGGRLHSEAFGSHHGVRAMAAPRRLKPQPERETQPPPAANAPLPSCKQTRLPPRQRQQRARKSPPAGAPAPQLQKRVMENVVILKRGEQIAPEILAALTGAPAKKAEPAAAADQRGSREEEAETMAAAQPQQCTMENAVILKRGKQIAPEISTELTVAPAAAAYQPGTLAEEDDLAETMAAAEHCSAQAKDDPVASAGKCNAPAKKEEDAALAADQGSAQAEMAKPSAAEHQCGATEPTPAAGQRKAPAKEEEVVAAADQLCTQAEMAGPSPAEGQCGVAEPTPGAGRFDAPAKEEEVVAAADKLRTQAEMAVAEPSAVEDQCGEPTKKTEAALVVLPRLMLMVSPEPSELPIPVLLLKPRRGCSRTAARA